MTTVCILAAGLGERMGELSYANKALVPFNNKALISNIIEIFPRNTRFVIALGFQSAQLKSYIKIAHSNLIKNINFVKVKKFRGPGSGPGYSLICCKKFLNKPFIFVACDTLLKNQINFNEKKNWVGTFKVKDEISQDYCNFEIQKKNRISGIFEKKKYQNKNQTSFIGICKINDHKIFWNSLLQRSKKNISPQISDGFHELIKKKKLFSKNIDWLDFGTYEKYKDMVSRFSKYDFSKTDEFIYIINRKVIKFFKNKKITEQRVMKSRLNKIVFPKCKKIDLFYSYDFINGNTLYKENNKKIFTELLKFLEEKLWIKKIVKEKNLRFLVKIFIKIKPSQELSYLEKKINFLKLKQLIKKALPFDQMRTKIFNKSLFDGVPCFIHGDLQFDNIIQRQKKFKLIDWRHSFDSSIECGDLYYDLAKLYGGIIVNYDQIKKNNFKFKVNNNNVSIIFQKDTFNLKSIYEKYLSSKKFDLRKIKILTGLIYLNMSPLHKHPFDKFLYSLGISMLNKEIYND